MLLKDSNARRCVSLTIPAALQGYFKTAPDRTEQCGQCFETTSLLTQPVVARSKKLRVLHNGGKG